jgi:hypothetical protein
MTHFRLAHLRSLALALLALPLILAGCATQPPQLAAAERAKPAMPSLEIQERLLALDPERVSDRDVQEVLAKSPTPRIMLLHGGIYPVHLLMESFGHFLEGMGYPAARIRDPRDGSWSYSPYEDSAKLAGIVAWDYERTGLRPMLIGHSQGGMQAVKVLYELAGKFEQSLHAYDPLTDRFDDRTTIIDPITHEQRPIVGLSVSYASAVGAGGAAFLLPNQWSMLDKLESIPNTVDDFTGFFIAVDPIGWSLPNGGFQHNGRTKVRNVELPATYSHVFVPLVSHLADEREVRDWINAYTPGDKRDPSSLPGDAAQHVLWAADVWYSIKKHWCLEAQHWVRAQRVRSGLESAAQ